MTDQQRAGDDPVIDRLSDAMRKMCNINESDIPRDQSNRIAELEAELAAANEIIRLQQTDPMGVMLANKDLRAKLAARDAKLTAMREACETAKAALELHERVSNVRYRGHVHDGNCSLTWEDAAKPVEDRTTSCDCCYGDMRNALATLTVALAIAEGQG